MVLVEWHKRQTVLVKSSLKSRRIKTSVSVKFPVVVAFFTLKCRNQAQAGFIWTLIVLFWMFMVLIFQSDTEKEMERAERKNTKKKKESKAHAW